MPEHLENGYTERENGTRNVNVMRGTGIISLTHMFVDSEKSQEDCAKQISKDQTHRTDIGREEIDANCRIRNSDSIKTFSGKEKKIITEDLIRQQVLRQTGTTHHFTTERIGLDNTKGNKLEKVSKGETIARKPAANENRAMKRKIADLGTQNDYGQDEIWKQPLTQYQNKEGQRLSKRARSEVVGKENQDPNITKCDTNLALSVRQGTPRNRIPERLRALLPPPRILRHYNTSTKESGYKHLSAKTETLIGDYSQMGKKSAILGKQEALFLKKEKGNLLKKPAVNINLHSNSSNNNGSSFSEKISRSQTKVDHLDEENVTEESSSDTAHDNSTKQPILRSVYPKPINLEIFDQIKQRIKDSGVNGQEVPTNRHFRSKRKYVSASHWRMGLKTEQRVVNKLFRFTLLKVRLGMDGIRGGKEVVNVVDYAIAGFWAAYIQGVDDAATVIRSVQTIIRECCVVFETFSVVKTYLHALKIEQDIRRNKTSKSEIRGKQFTSVRSVADTVSSLKKIAQRHGLYLKDINNIIDLVRNASAFRVSSILVGCAKNADLWNKMYMNSRRVRLLREHVSCSQHLERTLCQEASSQNKAALTSETRKTDRREEKLNQSMPSKIAACVRQKQTSNSLTGLLEKHSKFHLKNANKKKLAPLLPLWIKKQTDQQDIQTLRNNGLLVDKPVSKHDESIENKSASGVALPITSSESSSVFTLEAVVNFVSEDRKCQQFAHFWKWIEFISMAQSKTNW